MGIVLRILLFDVLIDCELKIKDKEFIQKLWKIIRIISVYIQIYFHSKGMKTQKNESKNSMILCLWNDHVF